MADDNGWNGSGGDTLFTNVRILDASGRLSLYRRGSGPGQPASSGSRGRQAPVSACRLGRQSRRGHGDRRDGRHADARPDRRPPAPLVEQRARHRPHQHDGDRGAHARSRWRWRSWCIDAGFTSGRGCGGGQAAAGRRRPSASSTRAAIPGPRYLAAGPEITTVGGLGDAAPSHIPHPGLNLGLVVSGPEEVRRTVRTLIKYGVDSIKLNLSGEAITGMGAEETPMSEEEVAMAASEAKCRGKVLGAHARSSRVGDAMHPPRHPEHLSCLLRQ